MSRHGLWSHDLWRDCTSHDRGLESSIGEFGYWSSNVQCPFCILLLFQHLSLHLSLYAHGRFRNGLWLGVFMMDFGLARLPSLNKRSISQVVFSCNYRVNFKLFPTKRQVRADK